MVPPRHPHWLLVQAIVWPLALTAVLALRTDPALARIGMPLVQVVWVGSLASLVAILRAWRTLADAVTIARGLLFNAVATWILITGGVTTTSWLLLGVALCADLIDGFCARRFGATDEGALLDLETDQLAFVGLAVLGFHYAEAPGTVFAVPGMRYAKVLAYRLCGVPAHAARPRNGDNRGARLCAALASALLFAMLAPGLGRGTVTLLATGAALTLVWSYRTDFLDLLAIRRERARGGDRRG